MNKGENAMLIDVQVKNCFSFEEQINFSMKADMRNKKFGANVHKESNFNILKAAGIFGPNNSGKTCFVKCIRCIKSIILNEKSDLQSNLFSKNHICELGVTFLNGGRKFKYDFKFNVKSKDYIYEKFVEITKDQYGNESEDDWLVKDNVNNIYHCKEQDIASVLSIVASNNLLIHLVDVNKFKTLSEIKRILISFASNIDIINMNNIPIQKTIDLMKNKNELQSKVADFIKNADLYLDDFKYVNIDKIVINKINENEKPEEKALEIPEQLMDQIRLVSVYKGVEVPSLLFDSTGTKKIAALASYIIDGLEKGRILIIDELDSSIHFKLTRAIVAMFNNELNDSAQMIFTVHDINLMDCQKLFRKEQIWFVHKDNDGVYMYSLGKFTAKEGIRGDSSLISEKYKKGILGALPDPELINSLLNIKGHSRNILENE